MDHQAQIEKEVQEHNEIHNRIQALEEEVGQLKELRSRKVGRIQLLQELGQEAAAESGGNDSQPEPLTVVPDGDPEG